MSGKRSPSPPSWSSHNPAPVAAKPSPAKVADTTNPQPKRPGGQPTEDEIRARAFALWEQAGRPEGDGTEFWYRAENELRNPY
jgi:hypothetical protein